MGSGMTEGTKIMIGLLCVAIAMLLCAGAAYVKVDKVLSHPIEFMLRYDDPYAR